MRLGPAARAEIAYAAVFAGLFMALGAHMAFLQIWLQDRGLTAAEIGALATFGVGVRILAGLALPALADRLRATRAMAVLLGALGCLSALAHLAADGLAALYAVTAAFAIAFAALIPLSDAAAYAAADRIGFSYARARSVGSFAFLSATFLVGGLIERFGSDAALWWMAAGMALAGLAAAATPSAAAPAADAPRRSPIATLVALLADGRIRLFLAAVGAHHASHAVYYAYGSVHWRALGFSETVIGALWAWGVLAEIAVFFLARGALERIGPARALALAGGAAALRWGAMALDPGLAATALITTLHGVTFGLTHIAALAFLAAHAPKGAAATAQGLMTAVSGGLFMVAATALAAWAYPLYAGGAYWLGAAAGLIGLAAAVALARGAQPQSAGSGANISTPR